MPVFPGRSQTLDAADHPPAAPPGYVWKAVAELSDEFDGSHLDESKWLPYQPYWPGRAPSRFETTNVTVEGGLLRLRSTALVTDMRSVKDPKKDIWVGAACLASRKPIAGCGYYAARVKASRLPMTSSFWFQGGHSEIDVVEEIGASAKNPDQDSQMFMNTHYFSSDWKRDKPTPQNWIMPSGAADEFHVYGVWWKDQDEVWFYHNGRKVAEVKTAGKFDEPMYLFFDTEVFYWEGLPTLEGLNDPKRNLMTVDWVRAWRLVKSP